MIHSEFILYAVQDVEFQFFECRYPIVQASVVGKLSFIHWNGFALLLKVNLSYACGYAKVILLY